MDLKTIMIKFGPQHLAKGVERGLRELDAIFPDAPIQPSLAGNIGLTILGAVGAFMAPSPYDEILAIYGGHHSTTLWDYIEGAITPMPSLARATSAPYTPTRPGLTRTLKYTPEQTVVSAPKFIPGVLRPKFQLGN